MAPDPSPQAASLPVRKKSSRGSASHIAFSTAHTSSQQDAEPTPAICRLSGPYGPAGREKLDTSAPWSPNASANGISTPMSEPPSSAAAHSPRLAAQVQHASLLCGPGKAAAACSFSAMCPLELTESSREETPPGFCPSPQTQAVSVLAAQRVPSSSGSGSSLSTPESCPLQARAMKETKPQATFKPARGWRQTLQLQQHEQWVESRFVKSRPSGSCDSSPDVALVAASLHPIAEWTSQRITRNTPARAKSQSAGTSAASGSCPSSGEQASSVIWSKASANSRTSLISADNTQHVSDRAAGTKVLSEAVLSEAEGTAQAPIDKVPALAVDEAAAECAEPVELPSLRGASVSDSASHAATLAMPERLADSPARDAVVSTGAFSLKGLEGCTPPQHASDPQAVALASTAACDTVAALSAHAEDTDNTSAMFSPAVPTPATSTQPISRQHHLTPAAQLCHPHLTAALVSHPASQTSGLSAHATSMAAEPSRTPHATSPATSRSSVFHTPLSFASPSSAAATSMRQAPTNRATSVLQASVTPELTIDHISQRQDTATNTSTAAPHGSASTSRCASESCRESDEKPDVARLTRPMAYARNEHIQGPPSAEWKRMRARVSMRVSSLSAYALLASRRAGSTVHAPIQLPHMPTLSLMHTMRQAPSQIHAATMLLPEEEVYNQEDNYTIALPPPATVQLADPLQAASLHLPSCTESKEAVEGEVKGEEDEGTRVFPEAASTLKVALNPPLDHAQSHLSVLLEACGQVWQSSPCSRVLDNQQQALL
jgi:hypothetical protein